LVEDKEDKVTNNNNKINIFIVPAERQNLFFNKKRLTKRWSYTQPLPRLPSL
jgi:hypothetical protein